MIKHLGPVLALALLMAGCAAANVVTRPSEEGDKDHAATDKGDDNDEKVEEPAGEGAKFNMPDEKDVPKDEPDPKFHDQPIASKDGQLRLVLEWIDENRYQAILDHCDFGLSKMGSLDQVAHDTEAICLTAYDVLLGGCPLALQKQHARQKLTASEAEVFPFCKHKIPRLYLEYYEKHN